MELCAFLCKKFGLSADDIIRHYDVTGKHCPLWYVSHPEDFKAFKEKVRAEISETAETKKKMYYVQVGAFSSKANAEKYLESVKKDYPNAFIKTM